MKIHDKKGLISGIVTLSICIMGVITIILKGLSVKLEIGIIILFLILITEIIRSFSETMSKENIIKSEE